MKKDEITTAKRKFRKCGFMLAEIKKSYCGGGDLLIYKETQTHAGRNEPRAILEISSERVTFDTTDWEKEWSPSANPEMIDAIQTQMQELKEKK